MGFEKVERLPNYILTSWHKHYLASGLVFMRRNRPHVWMTHDAAYMLPFNLYLILIGVQKLVFGATGNKGKEASREIVDYLREGYCSYIHPDGPKGPAKIPKSGVLHWSLQTGVPIAPYQIKVNWAITLKSNWAKEYIPLPFARIDVEFGEPFTVRGQTFEKDRARLIQLLG